MNSFLPPTITPVDEDPTFQNIQTVQTTQTTQMMDTLPTITPVEEEPQFNMLNNLKFNM